MKWHRRVLLVAAPGEGDPALAEQRRMIAAWRAEADDRDLSVVEVIGDAVRGAGDAGPVLRRRFALHDRFTVILIGKDGGEKLRSARPLDAATLGATIDAMPMRRAGQR